MERKIDKGDVLTQKTVRVKEHTTIGDLYKQCFEEGVDCLLTALEKISRGDFSPVINDYLPSYYSFPTLEDWTAFRKKGILLDIFVKKN